MLPRDQPDTATLDDMEEEEKREIGEIEAASA